MRTGARIAARVSRPTFRDEEAERKAMLEATADEIRR